MCSQPFPCIRFALLTGLVILPLPIGWAVETQTAEPSYLTDPRCASGGEHELVPIRYGLWYLDPAETHEGDVVYVNGRPAYLRGGCAVDPELPTYCVKCCRRALIPVESEYFSDYRP